MWKPLFRGKEEKKTETKREINDIVQNNKTETNEQNRKEENMKRPTGPLTQTEQQRNRQRKGKMETKEQYQKTKRHIVLC